MFAAEPWPLCGDNITGSGENSLTWHGGGWDAKMYSSYRSYMRKLGGIVAPPDQGIWWERCSVGWVLYISISLCIACAMFVVRVGVSAWKKSSSKSSIADLRSLHAGSSSSVAWLPCASMSFGLLRSESWIVNEGRWVSTVAVIACYEAY